MGVIIRQSIKGTIYTYIGAALGFVTQFFIVTKYLDPEVIGLTKVFYEVGTLCAGFALLGIVSSGMRFFPYFKDERTQNHGFLFYYLLIPFIGTLLVSLIYCLCKTPIVGFFSAKSAAFTDFFYLVVPLIFILTFWQAFETYSNINLRIAFPKWVREVLLRILLLVAYLLFAFHYIGLSTLLIALLVAYGMCMLADTMYVSRTTPFSIKHDSSFITKELRNKFLKYSGFLLLSVVTGNIISQLDIFMLSSLKGLYSAGVYTIAFYMANIIDMPSRSISAISTPLAAEALKNGDFHKANQLYQQVSLHQLMASGFIFLLIWVNMDNIYAIIPNGETFAEGRYVVLFLGLSKLISTTLVFGGVLIQFSRYYYWSLFISAFLTIVTIVTNLYFIPRMGISGAAFASLITCVISYSYQQFIVQRKVHGNPFTRNTLILILLLIILWGINLFIPSLTSRSPWLDLSIRTLLIGCSGLLLVYKLNISNEVTKVIGQTLHLTKLFSNRKNI